MIAQRRYTTGTEWIALPVTGDCELIFADMIPASEADLPHVAGWLSHNGDVIEVLNLNALTPGPIPLRFASPLQTTFDRKRSHEQAHRASLKFC